MTLSPFEREVEAYYLLATPGYYLQGWDPDHLHFGLFDPAQNANYEADPSLALADRATAVAAMTDRILGQSAPGVPGFGPGQRVVDAGCGVGGTALVLAHRGCLVTGVNLSALQVELAVAKAAKAGLADQADFVVANCSQALPFADSSVDAVVNIESACHYADRPRFLAEVARILKPGGRLVASDWVRKDRPTPQELDRLGAMCRAWHLAPPLESLESYRGLLADAGLTMVSSQSLGDEARANGLILEMGWKGTRSLPDILLSAELRERREQARTFADTFLDGTLGLGLYLAVQSKEF